MNLKSFKSSLAILIQLHFHPNLPPPCLFDSPEDFKSARADLTYSESCGIKMTETCRNPWNGKCTNSNIELYIYYKNKTLSICSRCWSQIADKDIEW